MKDSVANLLMSCGFDIVGKQRTRDAGGQTRAGRRRDDGKEPF